MVHPISEIDESGNIQYYKITLRDRLRYRVKARFIRLFANCYGLFWYLKDLWRQYTKNTQ